MKILIKGKVETVSVNRVNPAHFECEPETGTVTKRKMQSKTTNSKTTGIVRRTRKDQTRSSSTLTQKSDRTKVKSKTNTQTQSAATNIGKSLAITPQHLAHRVKLPRQLTPYVARVPSHLQSKTPNTTDKPKTPDVRKNSNIADSDKIISDTTVKQTRVGQKIQTPARFVQMVHAIVAPNDIYSGTNCPYRKNHNL